MKKILIVTTYKLAYDQMKELEQLDFEYIYMDNELKDKWGNIASELEMNDICEKILAYAKEKKCTNLFIMGYTPAVVYIVSKYGLENCCYSRTKEFLEEVKSLDETTKEIEVIRHIGFYSYLTNKRIMPSECL